MTAVMIVMTNFKDGFTGDSILRLMRKKSLSEDPRKVLSLAVKAIHTEVYTTEHCSFLILFVLSGLGDGI